MEGRFNGAATCSLRNDKGYDFVATKGGSLQWGRNLFVAECPASDWEPAWAKTGFNGAATCSLRNDMREWETDRWVPQLQWGRNLFVAE